jgi:S-adenosyl methyltransferase
MDAVPRGSYLAIGHHTADIYPEVSAFAARLSELNLAFPSTLRDRQQVRDPFAGLDLVEPGVVQISRWCPEPGPGTGSAPLWGGVGWKP